MGAGALSSSSGGGGGGGSGGGAPSFSKAELAADVSVRQLNEHQVAVAFTEG
jgi:hypothetical protein